MKKKSRSRKRLIITVAFTTLLLILIGLLVWTVVRVVIKNRNSYTIEPRYDRILEYREKLDGQDVDSWIRVQGTNIDYPVLYLDEYSNVPSEKYDYVWTLSKSDDLLDRTAILGHNIKNVSSNPLITDPNHSRFEQLMSFLYYDFARKNQYIQYTKNGKDYLYQIFSISFIDEDDLPIYGYLIDYDLDDYISKAIKDSYFDFDVEVDENDKIITLITCTRFFGPTTQYRFKVEGKLLEDDTKTKLADVKINNNYKEIKDIMEGGEVNEK